MSENQNTVISAVNTEAAEIAAPKKRGRKPGSKNKVKKEKAVTPKKPGRKANPKKARTPAPQIIFQIGGFEYNGTEIMERAKADYRASHKAGIHSCNIYIKPEENAAFYVINKVEGKIPIE